MKICLLTHTFPKSKNDSTAPFMDTLAMGIYNNSNEIYVLTPYTPDIKKEDFPYTVITYKYIWPDFLHILGYSRTLKEGSFLKLSAYFLSPFLFFFGIIALYSLCLKKRIDIISSHWILPNGIMAFVVSKLLKIPYTVTLPGSDIFLAKNNKIFSKMAVVAANNASMVFADSPKFLEDLTLLGAVTKNEDIIPYPVDISAIKSDKKPDIKLKSGLKSTGKELIILAVGRLIHKKGFSYLIQSFSIIAKKYPKTRLIIVGNGDLKEKLKLLAIKLKIDKKITFTGYMNRKKIFAYYNFADIFVMPSIKDESGNMDDQPVALIEAMACGKPIIATNFPGIRLTVENGRNGILVAEKNTKQIAEALEKMIVSKKIRDKMGAESKIIVYKKLSSDVISKRYLDHFREIC